MARARSFVTGACASGFTAHDRPPPRCRGHLTQMLHTSTCRKALLLVWPFAPSRQLLRPRLTSRSVLPRRPFRHEARSPQVRTHSFTAQPPDLRHFALITRASWSFAHSPCSAAPSIRFLSIGSQFMLHASSPRSVALTQLRFTSFAVINLRRDLHPQECAHAGRTWIVKKGGLPPFFRPQPTDSGTLAAHPGT